MPASTTRRGRAAPAILGYGRGDEGTVVSYGPNASQRYLTTYFRRTFNVDNAAAVTGLQLRLQLKDGAVVYVNGVEVARAEHAGGHDHVGRRTPR